MKKYMQHSQENKKGFVKKKRHILTERIFAFF